MDYGCKKKRWYAKFSPILAKASFFCDLSDMNSEVRGCHTPPLNDYKWSEKHQKKADVKNYWRLVRLEHTFVFNST